MKKHTKIIIIIISILMVLCIALSCHIWYCENIIYINRYNIKTDKLNSSLKLAFISDLHHKEFGKNNTDLVNAISSEKPDLITVGGDMVTNTDQNHTVVITLLEQLVDIAPTYYALGNHERNYQHLKNLKDDIKNTGAVLLDNEMIAFDVGNEKITIGGLTEYPYYEFYTPSFENEERYFLDAFIEQEKNNYSILLAHQPEFYMWSFDEKNLDLMLCGHTHGGLINIPFIGDLYAPNQGFFPEYTKGYYSSGTANMIITGGLGNSSIVPRVNNQVEICVININ